MTQSPNPFEYSGAITDLDTAINRPEMEKVITSLYRDEYISVLAPRQSGKTTFLKQLEKRITEPQTEVVYISFDKRGSYEGGIKDVVEEIVQQVKAKFPQVEPVKKFSSVQDFLTSLNPVRLVFLVDELPSPEDTAFRFVSQVRAYYSSTTPTDRHRFVFAGSIDLGEFSRDQNEFISPFNIVTTIYLEDFRKNQVAEWIRVRDKFSPAVVEKVFEYTGGQPFLVQFLCAYLYSLSTNAEREAKLAEIETLIQDSQVENTANIKTMVDKVLDTKEWRDLLGKILEGLQIPFTTSHRIVRNLYLNGCISKGEDGYCKLRNPIYAKIFEENYTILRASSSSALSPRKGEYSLLWVTLSVSPEREGNVEICPTSDGKVYRLQAGKSYQFKVTLSNFEPPQPGSQSLKMDAHQRKREVEFEVELESFFNLGLQEMAKAKSIDFSEEEGMWSFVFPIQPGNKTITGDNTIKAVPVFVNLYQDRLPVKVIKQLIEVN